jgi:hypothetical protein
MAPKATIENKLLGNLTESQRSLVEEYYKLQNSQAPSKPERLCAIWEVAQTDLILCKRLELVDDLCNDFSEDFTSEDSDSQAFQSEYLVSKLEATLNQEEGRVPVTTSEGSTWLVECPDRQNLSTITLPSDNPQIMQQFKDQTCGRCQTPYGTHNWELLAETAAHN